MAVTVDQDLDEFAAQLTAFVLVDLAYKLDLISIKFTLLLKLAEEIIN